MPTIVERDGKFVARVRLGKYKPVAKTFNRRSDAKAWGLKVEADMQAGRWVEQDTSAPTVRDALSTYQKTVVAGLKGAKTYSYWLEELKASTLAAKRVNEVTAADLSAWRDTQAVTLSAGTVVRKLGLLGGFLTWCHKDKGWTTGNPLESVRKPRVSDARDRVLTANERVYLLAAAGTSRAGWLSDALVVLLRSAMRRGELFSLTAGDVDFARSVAHLSDTKNGSARDVPLDSQAAEALRRLVTAAQARAAQQRQQDKPPAGAEPLIPLTDPHAVSLAFRRTLARAQAQHAKDCQASGLAVDAGFLAGVRLHDLRHCAATDWASTGQLSMLELMAVTGHKTPKMVARYVSLSASTLAGKLSAIAA